MKNAFLKNCAIVLISLTQIQTASAVKLELNPGSAFGDSKDEQMSDQGSEEAHQRSESHLLLGGAVPLPFFLHPDPVVQQNESLPMVRSQALRHASFPADGLIDLEDDSFPGGPAMSSDQQAGSGSSFPIHPAIGGLTSRLSSKQVVISDQLRFFILSDEQAFMFSKKLNQFIKDLPEEFESVEDRLTQIGDFLFNHFVGERDIPKIFYINSVELDLLRQISHF
jgi:hypothetical protein